VSHIIKVAIVQHSCGDDYAENLQRSIAGIKEAAAMNADIVLLPELHTGPYFCVEAHTRHFDRAEAIPGPTTDHLGTLAKELGIIIICSLFEKRSKGLYHNTAVVLDSNGEIAGRYRKMHIPDDPGYYEKFYFTPGDLGFKPIQASIGELGVLVCWDQWFPEAARLISLAGAEILFYPSAIGWDPSDDQAEKDRQREAWITIQRAHAIANNLPVVSSNRIGHETDPSGATAGADFWGSSFICGQQGEILSQAPADAAAVIISDIDLERTDQVRRIWPYLRDRRIDAYQDILRRHIDDE
jgi:N-carbamoylputrescine amidase